MSLLDKLKAGKNNIKLITWPGTNEQVGIVVLTESEIQSAHFDTELYFKSAGIEYSFQTSTVYQSEQNTQVLARAIVDPEKKDKNGNPSRIFSSAAELRGFISHPDVKAALIQEYADWQMECSPRLESMTEEQYQQLFEDIKKNPSVLNDSDLRTQRGLIIYLANRPATLPTASGSISS